MGAAAAQAAAAAAGGGAGREAPAAGGTAATEGAADAVRAAEAAALAGEQAVAALVHAVAPWGAPHAAQPRPAPASQLLWAVDGAEGVQGSSTGAGWVSQGAGRGATAASLCRRLAATVLWQGSERAVAGQLRPQEDPGLAPVATAASNVPGQLPGLPSSGPAVQASQLDAPALWGFQRAVSQLSQAGSSQSAAAAGVGGPGGAQARAQQALASKTLWEDAAQAMGEQHRAQLGQLWRPGQGALPAGRVGAAEGSEDEEAWEEFVVRPSFAQCRLEEQSAAAARIQAAVRGRAARLALKVCAAAPVKRRLDDVVTVAPSSVSLRDACLTRPQPFIQYNAPMLCPTYCRSSSRRRTRPPAGGPCSLSRLCGAATPRATGRSWPRCAGSGMPRAQRRRCLRRRRARWAGPCMDVHLCLGMEGRSSR